MSTINYPNRKDELMNPKDLCNCFSSITKFLGEVNDVSIKLRKLAERLEDTRWSSIRHIDHDGLTYDQYYDKYVKEMQSILDEAKELCGGIVKE